MRFTVVLANILESAIVEKGPISVYLIVHQALGICWNIQNLLSHLQINDILC
jgi:hypothetical protein